MIWVELTALAVGLSMALGRRAGGSAYVRRHPGTGISEEQMQAVYQLMGTVVTGGALLCLAITLLSS
jgi:hypothetical protein